MALFRRSPLSPLFRMRADFTLDMMNMNFNQMGKNSSVSWTSKYSHRACPCQSGKFGYDCCWKGGKWYKTPVGEIGVKATGVKNPNCYLASEGDCSQKLTREHFISRNILEQMTNSTLNFKNAGFFFGGKEEVAVAVDSFSAKVLCDAHNSALSELDTSAGTAFTAIQNLYQDMLRAENPKEYLKTFYLASGIDLERWLIKVLCGLVAAGKFRTASKRTVVFDELHPSLLRALIGTQDLREPLGLYHHAFAGQERRSGGFSFAPIHILDGSDKMGGLILSLGLMNLVLVTADTYGKTFYDPNWYRRPSGLFDGRKGKSRFRFNLTY